MTHAERRKLTREQVERARTLRREMSVAEKIFWKLAHNRQLGFEIRRQHPYAGFTLDFYCAEAALAIEFDGELHDGARDLRRDEALRAMDIETLRVPNREFFLLDRSELPSKDWIGAIIKKCEERSGRKVER